MITCSVALRPSGSLQQLRAEGHASRIKGQESAACAAFTLLVTTLAERLVALSPKTEVRAPQRGIFEITTGQNVLKGSVEAKVEEATAFFLEGANAVKRQWPAEMRLIEE